MVEVATLAYTDSPRGNSFTVKERVYVKRFGVNSSIHLILKFTEIVYSKRNHIIFALFRSLSTILWSSESELKERTISI